MLQILHYLSYEGEKIAWEMKVVFSSCLSMEIPKSVMFISCLECRLCDNNIIIRAQL